MSVLYQVLYLVGVRPWEQDGLPRQLRELVEGSGALPPGRALDVGCGTGGPSVYLAQHGWDVTGVDVVARALAQARARARRAGVSLRLVRGDATEVADEVRVGGGYQLVLDTGCYHGLGEARRAAYAQVLAELAPEGATLLLYAIAPGGVARPRSFRGADEAEIRARFGSDWELSWKRPHEGRPVFGGAGQFWYLLKRRTASAPAAA